MISYQSNNRTSLSSQYVYNIGEGGGYTLLGKVLGASLQLIYITILSRVYGAEVSGLFIFIISLISFSSIVGQIGAHELVLRYIPYFRAQKNTGRFFGVVAFGFIFPLIATTLLSVLMYFNAETISNFAGKPEITQSFRIAIISIPVLAITRVSAAALQGLKHLGRSSLLRDVGIPLVTLVAVILCWAADLSLETLSFFYIVGNFLWAFFSLGLVRKTIRPELWDEFQVDLQLQEWFAYCFSVVFLDITRQAGSWIDTLVLGFVHTGENVAIFYTASRLSLLITLIFAVMRIVIAPLASELWAKGDRAKLEHVFSLTTRWTWIGALPIGIISILLNKELMLIFGEVFQTGSPVFLIIIIGRLILALTGSGGSLLIMTGYQRIEVISSVISSVVMTAGMIWGAIHYGIIGVAVSKSLVVILSNVVKLILVKHFLGIQPYRKNFIPLVFASIGAGMAGWIAYQGIVVASPIVLGTIVSLIVLCVFITILFASGLTPDDKEFLRMGGERIKGFFQ